MKPDCALVGCRKVGMHQLVQFAFLPDYSNPTQWATRSAPASATLLRAVPIGARSHAESQAGL